MLKLKLQYFGHLMRRADSLEKTLMLEKSEQKRRRGWQRMRWLDGTISSMDINLGKLGRWRRTEKPDVLHGIAKSQTRPSNWTATKGDLKLLEYLSCWRKNFCWKQGKKSYAFCWMTSRNAIDQKSFHLLVKTHSFCRACLQPPPAPGKSEKSVLI